MIARLTTALLVAICALGATRARADTAAADTCASTLPPSALALYETIAPQVRPDSSLESLLRAELTPKVMFGGMSRADARAAAEAAAPCLEMRKS